MRKFLIVIIALWAIAVSAAAITEWIWIDALIDNAMATDKVILDIAPQYCVHKDKK